MAGMKAAGNRLKDKKIELFVTKEYVNEMHQTVQKLVSIGKVWAYYRHYGAKEFIEAQKAQINEELYFEINWRNDLTVNKTWVKYKNKVFKVVRIDDYEGYKTSLRIYVNEDDKKL